MAKLNTINSRTSSQDSTIAEQIGASHILRGVQRVLAAHGFAGVAELPLATGRRADFAALDAKGTIWIVEIKSSLGDFRTDQKWPEYKAFCDRLLFAVAPEFPVDVLPRCAGLLLADRFGGDLVNLGDDHPLKGARRKAMTLRLARAAAMRLHALSDPEFQWDTTWT